MAGAVVEVPEVIVTGELIPMEEFDKVRNAVCLLKSSTKILSKSWSGTGFYVNMKLKQKNVGNLVNVGCIMTNYHVYAEMEESGDGMTAIFNHESTEKEAFEVPLVPFKLIAQSKPEDLDYVLIRVDESCLQSKGIKPILTDKSSLPVVKANDTVYIIQHPAGMRKHFSQDTVRRVNKPFIEYYPDTQKGSSGSPVFVWNKSKKFSLVALHSKGVLSQYQTDNWNKGVLLADILDHLHTGKVTKPVLPVEGVPYQVEIGTQFATGKKDPKEPVTRDDIIYIAKDITDEWQQLGMVLGLEDSILKIINADNPKVYNKCYGMLTKWTQIMVSKANYGALATGFANPVVNRPDLITKYC